MEALDDANANTELEAHLQALADAAPRFAALTPAELLPLLEQVRANTLEVASEWVELSCKAKGLAPDSPLCAEEWVSGPWATLAGLNGLIRTMSDLAAGKDPTAGFSRHTRPDGQVVVDVFPSTVWDRLLLSGFHAEVWQQPGVQAADLKQHIARRFREPVEGQVALILGAGNINAIPPLDALYKLIAEGEVCIVKLNPINEYLAGPLTRAFQPFVDAGYLRFVLGDGPVGAWLANHPTVATMHITGSVYTHDAVVFGVGEEGQRRKQANEPVNPRPMTSELGGVGPTMIVPGPWTDADFRFQAEHLVTQKLHNRGFNCIASQILVVPKGWDGTSKLLAAVKQVLREVVGDRPDYYKGVDDRRQGFLDAYPNAETIGDSFVFVEGLDAAGDEYAFQEEAFGPVWAVVELEADDAPSFIDAAVAFANDRLLGTLGAQLLIHPTTEKAHGDALDKAIAALRYGTIGINAWCGVGFLLPYASWGAFPGHTLNDVQSGIGVVHNALLFDAPQKTVVRGPFQPFPRTLARGQMHLSPKPLWFVTHAHAETAARHLTAFEGNRNVLRLGPIFAAALTG